MHYNTINPYCYCHHYLLLLCITGYKFYYFIDSVDHCWELQDKSSFLFPNEYNFCTIWLISYFWCTHIHTSSLINIIYFFDYIIFLLQSLLLRYKNQNTCCEIKRKRSNIQPPKDLSYLGVVGHSEGDHSTFVSCQFCDYLGTTTL